MKAQRRCGSGGRPRSPSGVRSGRVACTRTGAGRTIAIYFDPSAWRSRAGHAAAASEPFARPAGETRAGSRARTAAARRERSSRCHSRRWRRERRSWGHRGGTRDVARRTRAEENGPYVTGPTEGDPRSTASRARPSGHLGPDCARSLEVSGRERLAEAKGFEPLVPDGTAVFKTAAFDHSATPPRGLLARRWVVVKGHGGTQRPHRSALRDRGRAT